jgi:hypothetical protein
MASRLMIAVAAVILVGTSVFLPCAKPAATVPAMMGIASGSAENTLNAETLPGSMQAKAALSSYSAVIWSWDSSAGWLELPITMDRVQTGFKTPHTFTGLRGTHTFAMPGKNPLGHWFSDWSNDCKELTITVTSGGTYTARYRESYSATIWSWDSVDGWLALPIIMDGVRTPYKTPHTFPGLNGSHTFTMPGKNARRRPFKEWSTDCRKSTITISAEGTYTARYGE